MSPSNNPDAPNPPLSDAQIRSYREKGVPLAFDPVQIGWVVAEQQANHDEGTGNVRPGWPSVGQALRGTEAPRLSLRPWQSADTGVYIQLLDNPKVWQYLPEPYPDPVTRDAAAALIALSTDAVHHEVRAVLVGDEIVGQVRLLHDTEGPGTGELSYWLGEPFWNKGLGEEIVRVYVRKLFTGHSGLQTLVARVHPSNIASVKLLEKCGFIRASASAQVVVLRLNRGGG